jgi:hypothetical protein
MTTQKPWQSWWIDFSADYTCGENPVMSYEPNYEGAQAVQVVPISSVLGLVKVLCLHMGARSPSAYIEAMEGTRSVYETIPPEVLKMSEGI